MSIPREDIITIDGVAYAVETEQRRLRNINGKEVVSFKSDHEFFATVFWARELQPIIGAKAVTAGVTMIDFVTGCEDMAPCIRFDNGHTVIGFQDEEMNGPGALYLR